MDQPVSGRTVEPPDRVTRVTTLKRFGPSAVAVTLSVILHLLGFQPLAFLAAALAIVPLAGVIGNATEDLATHVGPRLGGLLNATFGNVTELIIAIFLIVGGEIQVVKISIIGSIIGNLLLVLGAAFFFGGIKHRELLFDPKIAGMHSASLLLAVVGIVMPAMFHNTQPRAGFVADETISAGVAGILILLYISSLVFSFVTNQEMLTTHYEAGTLQWSKGQAIAVLAIATAFVAMESEFLVKSLEPASRSLGLGKAFIGLILIPIVGNAAEHWSAVSLAVRNKTDTSIEIAIGSSTQIALFVAPLLVFISLAVGHPMDFFFSRFEIAAVGLSTLVVTVICLDGRSNWLEGAQLLAAYVIMGISFYFL